MMSRRWIAVQIIDAWMKEYTEYIHFKQLNFNASSKFQVINARMVFASRLKNEHFDTNSPAI